WPKFRKQKGAIKLHCQLDHSGHIPSFVHISDGKMHDAKAVKGFFEIEPDRIYCVDKAYVDYEWLHTIHKTKDFFVTRAKTNMDYSITEQHSEGEILPAYQPSVFFQGANLFIINRRKI
ncbi:MAG: transposase, partial [Pontiella sp.]